MRPVNDDQGNYGCHRVGALSVFAPGCVVVVGKTRFTPEQWFALPFTLRQRFWKETNYGRSQPSDYLIERICFYNKGEDAMPQFGELDNVRGQEQGPLNLLRDAVYKDHAHWWFDLVTGAPRDPSTAIALMHSELSEALEGMRKDKMDEHLPHRRSEEVEIADLLIRTFDYAGKRGLDLDGAVAEKRAYNAHRADHKRENRLAPGGKKF